MIFNLKYLMLPLSIMACINNSCINAMEENNINDMEDNEYVDSYEIEDGEYSESYEREDKKELQELTNLKSKIKVALMHLQDDENSALISDEEDENRYKIMGYLENLSEYGDKNELEQSEDYKSLIEIIGNNGFKNLEDYLDKLLSTKSNNITNYSDENEDQIDTTEKNENIQLSPQIIEQLRSDLYYYSNHYNNPSLLDLESKMESGTLTMDEKKFLLDFYNEKNKNKKVDNKYFPVSEDKFNDEENTIYEEEQDENERLIEIIVKTIDYLENKVLFLDKNSIEYKKITEQIESFNKLLFTRDIFNEITEQQQEDLFKLQDEMNEKEQEETSNLQDEITQEQSEKANPTESDEITEEKSEVFNPTESEKQLQEMINKSRTFLQSKIRFKEYKPGSKEYENAKKIIEECDNLIEDKLTFKKDIKNNITKTQYEYFKRLQDEN